MASHITGLRLVSLNTVKDDIVLAGRLMAFIVFSMGLAMMARTMTQISRWEDLGWAACISTLIIPLGMACLPAVHGDRGGKSAPRIVGSLPDGLPPAVGDVAPGFTQRLVDPGQYGDTERWTLSSDDGQHVFHPHQIQFQILAINGEPPPPEESGWEDSVLVNADREVVIVARFNTYVAEDTPYMFHCHILDHEDLGMMGQFLIVE